MKFICLVALTIVGFAAADVSHLSGYDYTPPAPPAPAPEYLPPSEEIIKSEAIAPPPAPAPEYLPPAAPAPPPPAPEYLPPTEEIIEPEAIAPPPPAPAPEYLPPAAAAVEPIAAHELQDDGYHYRSIKRYRYRTRV